MKFRYVFEDVRDTEMWIIDYAEIKGTQLVFDDNIDYSKYKIVDIHQYLFTTSDNHDIYENDWIRVCRGDSLRDHTSQVQKGRNGGAVIYHDILAKIGQSGFEDATYWMQHCPSIVTKGPNVYFYRSWEDYNEEENNSD